MEELGKSKFGFKEQQYQILKAKDTRALGTSLLIIPEFHVLVLTKRHLGSGSEIDFLGKWYIVNLFHNNFQVQYLLLIKFSQREIVKVFSSKDAHL